MYEAVISAIITGICAVIVSIVNSHYQASATRNLIEYKIGELTKRVEKHNNVIERMYNLEQTQAVMEEQIKVANHRIEDLERVKGD